MNLPETDAAAPARRPVWMRFLIGRSLGATLVRSTITALVILLVARFVLVPVRVKGSSMEPTYQDGELNLINRLSYLSEEPRRGDIVGIQIAGFRAMYMKRIIGLPGETISIQAGQVLVNGEPLAEAYVKNRAPWRESAFTLDPGVYFVIGDNRGMHQRDHYYGKVERWRIAGKVVF